MIAEVLIYKGLVAIGHYAAAHLTGGIVAKAACVATKMTIGQILTATAAVGFATGCIVWTGERIANLKKGAKAIADGHYKAAVMEFGQIALSSGASIDLLPDCVEKALEKIHLDSTETRKVTSWIKSNEVALANYVSTHK